MPRQLPGRFEQVLLVVLCFLAGLSVVLLVGQVFSPQPITMFGLSIDRLSSVMSLLVAGVGTVVYRYAQRHLDGEPGQRLFLRWLCTTVVAAYTLMLATHLLLLFAAWLLVSIGLHQLLTFYTTRAAALPPARKKFLISRLGDVALLSAIGLIWWRWETLDLRVFLQRVAESGDWGGATSAAAVLVVLAALAKSAQFPFHSWLPETMEAPTPVSALMHAGIINAGGVLLLRFAPLLVMVPVALLLLSVVGTITAALAAFAMWTQPTVKRTLAWSTVGQMGFMMVQCGLAAFPAAALHIVGHGCYKAWSFLRAGELPVQTVPATSASPSRTLLAGVIGCGFAIPVLAAASFVTGFDPLHSPGELALAAVVALSAGQIWAALLRDNGSKGFAGQVGNAILLSVGLCFAAFALYRGAALFLAPVLGELPAPTGLLAWAAAIIPVATFAALAVIHTLLPLLGRSHWGRAMYIHALHGFYVGAFADRFVERVWAARLERNNHV